MSGSFPVKFPSKIFFLKNFYCTKRFVFEFQGSLLGYVWAIVLISAVISILEDFGSLLPARFVTVNGKNIMRVGRFNNCESQSVTVLRLADQRFHTGKVYQ